MLSIVLSNDLSKLLRQKESLEWELTQDIPKKDRDIFAWSLEAIEIKIAELQSVK